MYLKTNTRPHLVVTVTKLSKFNQNPVVAHWKGLKQVLRNINGTMSEGMLYKRGAHVEVCGYSNVGHAGDKETFRGQSGYVFFSTGAAISWHDTNCYF